MAGDASKPRNQYQLPPIMQAKKASKALPRKMITKQIEKSQQRFKEPQVGSTSKGGASSSTNLGVVNMDPCQDIMMSTGKANMFADMDKFLSDPNKTVQGESKVPSDTIKEAESFLQELSARDSRSAASRGAASHAARPTYVQNFRG